MTNDVAHSYDIGEEYDKENPWAHTLDKLRDQRNLERLERKRRRRRLGIILGAAALAVATVFTGLSTPNGKINKYLSKDISFNFAQRAQSIHNNETLEVMTAHEPIVIHGVKDINIGILGTIAYRRGINITGGTGATKLDIDNSAVDTNREGTYQVIYIATDEQGNEVRQTANVIVNAHSKEEVDALLNPILEEIITPDMDRLGKIQAIHDYVRNNVYYAANSKERDGVLDGAYNGLKMHRGDCFTSYALLRYMLDSVGVESVDMQRVEGYPSTHFWLAVEGEDGKYRHLDATRVANPKLLPRHGFMMTEAEAQSYATASNRPEYYHYDSAVLPDGVEIAQ